MPHQAVVYRVMVASPSDAHEEREAVSSVLANWNGVNALETGVVLLPLRWEIDAYPELGSEPQSIIHRQLTDQADILIALFKGKIGAPTSQAISGTVEEIERFLEHAKPVLLYFSDVPLQPSAIDPIQIQRVIEFKKSIEKRGLYAQFTSIDQFKTQLATHITRLIREVVHNSTSSQGGVPDAITATQVAGQNDAGLPIHFRSAFTSLRAQWTAERTTGPSSISPAKALIDSLGSLMQGVGPTTSSSHTPELAAAVNSILMQVQSIKRHRLNLDGGLSLRAFWDQGSQIFDQAEHVIASLEGSGSQSR